MPWCHTAFVFFILFLFFFFSISHNPTFFVILPLYPVVHVGLT